ncbi:MAG: hypothetical protein ISS78_05550 [Phycisphaerae bacterium]|nr:hypothetical protein [Phycisphaerae bacterium]
MDQDLQAMRDDLQRLELTVSSNDTDIRYLIPELRTELNDRIDAADKSIQSLVQPLDDTMDVLHPEEHDDRNSPPAKQRRRHDREGSR